MKETLADKLHEFGMELDSVQVKDIQLDTLVMEAMNNVVASNKINSQRSTKQKDANNQTSSMLKQIKEVKKLLGEGMALQRSDRKK